MNMQSLQYFVVLAKWKNFTAAAQECHISQSAFSRRIKSLETDIGVDLIVSNKKEFQLTTAGERLLVHAHHILEDVNQLKDIVCNEGHTSNKNINITLMYAIAVTKAGALQTQISALDRDICPKYCVRTVYDGLDMLKKKQTDLLVIYGAQHWSLSVNKSQYDFQVIGREKIIPVCHCTHYYDLNKETDEPIPMLEYTANNTILSISINRMLEKCSKIRFKCIAQSDFSYTLYDILKNGHSGVCWIPETMVKHHIESGEFLHLGDGKWDFEYDIRVYTNNENINPIVGQIVKQLKL